MLGIYFKAAWQSERLKCWWQIGVTYEGAEIDMKVVNGIYYTAIGVSIVFALASLFGVLGSVTVSEISALHATTS